MIQATESIGGKLIFEKAKSENFKNECDKHVHQISDNIDIEMLKCNMRNGMRYHQQ